MLKMLRRMSERRRVSDALLGAMLAQARRVAFYREYAVADTIDGRFDVLALHAWMVLDRLAELGETALRQSLTDGLFVQFDEALREQGAGDMGMGRRMTRMADALYGRLKAYREASDTGALAAAFVRNVYRGDDTKLEEARRLAIYAHAARERLAGCDLRAGECDFGAPPELRQIPQ